MRRLLPLVVLAATACSKNPYEDAFAYSGPESTRAGLFWIDQTHGEILFALPGDTDLELVRAPIADERARIAWAVPTRDRQGVLALRVPVSEKEEDVVDQLLQLPADGDGEPIVYDLLAPFTHVTFSPDHRRAVLHFGGQSGSDVLQNANQVAILDLSAGAVRDLTLDGFGGRLQGVQFPNQSAEGVAAPVMIGGRARDIVAFLADGEIVLVDADDPAADQVAVRFFPDVAFSPSATILRPGNELFPDPALFLRAESGADVAMLTLVDHPDELTGVSGFSAQVSLIPVGDGASDFTLHDSEDVPYLVTVDPSARVVFTDIRTQQGFAVELDGAAQRVYVRQHQTDTGPIDQLVLWSQGGQVIHTLDLDGIEDAVGRRPERLTIETGIEELVRLDNDRVLIGSGSVLYVVDFRDARVTPLTSMVPYDPSFSALDGDMLLLGTPFQSWISTVDLQTLDPESMALDDPIANFHYIEEAGVVALVHDDPAGHVTIARAGAPSRATSYSVWGILHEGLLDRGDGR